jgi:hypothetical protein
MLPESEEDLHGFETSMASKYTYSPLPIDGSKSPEKAHHGRTFLHIGSTLVLVLQYPSGIE